MMLIIFLSILCLGHCRPQSANRNSGVEIEKQMIIRVPNYNENTYFALNPQENKYRENTLNILHKIAEVNINHTSTDKQEIESSSKWTNNSPLIKNNKSKQLPNFQFSSMPFSNPIFDYLKGQHKEKIVTRQSSFKEGTEDIPEDYKILRKVTHIQTYFIPTYYQQSPNPYNFPIFAPVSQYNPSSQSGEGQYGLITLNQQSTNDPENMKTEHTNNNQNKQLDEIAQVKQNYLINNIKNIMSNSQVEKYQQDLISNTYNPYMSYQQSHSPMMPYEFYMGQDQNFPHYNLNPYQNVQIQTQKYPQILPYFNSDTYLANLQANFSKLYQNPLKLVASSRQFNGPFAQYFPLVIKNPFQQIFQAFTNMIEYGPEADICRRNHENERNNPNIEPSHVLSEPSSKSKSSKLENAIQRLQEDVKYTNNINIEMNSKNPSVQLRDEDTDTEIIIDDIEEIGSNESSINKAETRKISDDKEPLIEKKFLTSLKISPRQEPGNSIVIHKLRVRKGGVAIAGPGGIATAGSGGTAIVGPNGFAYTQPNGVAIAGPGSRVIAVDPGVDLSEVVANLTNGNDFIPRLGKVVAVGPVVYHNLGQD